jgi:hypothetical protein
LRGKGEGMNVEQGTASYRVNKGRIPGTDMNLTRTRKVIMAVNIDGTYPYGEYCCAALSDGEVLCFCPYKITNIIYSVNPFSIKNLLFLDQQIRVPSVCKISIRAK